MSIITATPSVVFPAKGSWFLCKLAVECLPASLAPVSSVHDV